MNTLLTLGGLVVVVHYTIQKGGLTPYYEVTSVKLPGVAIELLPMIEYVDGLQYIEAQLTLLHMKDPENDPANR